MTWSSPPHDLLDAIRRENLNVYRASPQRLREDIGQEAQIAQDYRGRLVYELLQNADDALAGEPGAAATIRFVITDDSLWVGNSGRALEEADVRGLCGISASSKTQMVGQRRASIGHKGMGFKSVLEITDAPEVYSTSVAFRFGPEDALRAVRSLVDEGVLDGVTRAPIARFPWGVEREPEEWQRMRAAGLRTAFRFPFRKAQADAQRDRLTSTLRDLPVTALVFLKHLRRIEVEIRHGRERHAAAWSVARQRVGDTIAEPSDATSRRSGVYRVALTSDRGEAHHFVLAHDEDVVIGDHRGGLDEFAWEGIAYAEVSVAAHMVDARPAPLQAAWRRLHVFLPTAEPCPYDLLVSGAFSSNLSRQEIRVEPDATHYNRFLLGQVARLTRDALLPTLLRDGAAIEEVIPLLARRESVGAPCATAAAQTLHAHMREALAAAPLVPSEAGAPLAVADCVLPPLVPDRAVGRAFRGLLGPDAGFGARTFPGATLCGSDLARVLVDHGAWALQPAEAARALAAADAERSRLREHESGGFWVDPVLHVLERLWAGFDEVARAALVAAIRHEKLFPVGRTDAGNVRRVSTANLACFYPPRSLHGEVPLDGLCFLLQDLCWGALTPKERTQYLHEHMAAWQALFDLREFKFPDVMRASVLPALDLERDDARPERVRLRDLDRLAAICQLAGRTPRRNAPLPYERLGPNRALFNLSRLEVPCRGPAPETVTWVPAYRAYLGVDWIGPASIEPVLAAAREAGMAAVPAVSFLLGPERFAGRIEQFQHLKETEDDGDRGSDEVSVDEDDEVALDADDHTRWLGFLLWLGVNRAMRPVHFHDVEDRGAGWLTTADLVCPEGRAFARVSPAEWRAFVGGLRAELAALPPHRLEAHTPYFYRLHDLEHLAALLDAAARDASAGLARALYEHLARNWDCLERFAQAAVALIPQDHNPRRRQKPPRAKDDELVELDDFWLERLRRAAFCPTAHGPRSAPTTWLPTPEVQRRFGRRGRTDAAACLLPTLDVTPALARGRSLAFAQVVGLREELTPASFSLNDARALLERIRDLYAPRVARGEDLRLELREVIRPAYRHMLELLSGRERDAGLTAAAAPPAPLSNAPVLALGGDGRFAFRAAAETYYLDRRDTRDRLGVPDQLWTFAIDALPLARAPLVQVFGMRVLEDALRWKPRQGDPALVASDLATFRGALRELAPYVLARIGAERSDERTARYDARRLRRFVDALEPVGRLQLSCELEGRVLPIEGIDREAFVAFDVDDTCQAFVVWGECPWPPSEAEAEALAVALGDTLGPGYFESFLALARAPSPAARLRILRRAGAPTDLEEKRTLFAGLDEGTEEASVPVAATPKTSAEPATAPAAGEEPSEPEPDDRLALSRTRLLRPEAILLDGVPVVLIGSVEESGAPAQPPREGAGARGHRDNSRGFGGQTDLDLLDALGMSIVLQYERNRLQREGHSGATVFDPARPGAQPDALVFDVSRPSIVARACEASPRLALALAHLHDEHGISRDWPGFDVLSLDPQQPHLLGRLIELKSSGVASRVQEMSWNEWKTARASRLREYFYLALVGNLRADLGGARPFIRLVRNPFEQLVSVVQVDRRAERVVQLSVDRFREAEHLDLGVADPPNEATKAKGEVLTGLTESTP